MPFFSDSSLGGFQPKRKFRFTVSFKNLGQDLVYMVKDIKKPSYTLSDTTHQFMNHQYKFPGILTWDDVECSFIDAVEPNVGSKFYKTLLNSGYVAPTGFANALQGITKVQSVGTIGDVVIRQLDGGSVVGGEVDPANITGAPVTPNVIEEWTLKNTFITKTDFGELSYDGGEELVTVSLTLKYDYALYSDTVVPYNG